MAVPFIQASFATGEVSPSLFGHVDLAKMHSAAATMRNLFASYRGGAYSRAGTLFVGYSKQTGRTKPPRLITFQFSINQGLCLEFGHLYMRVIRDGAFVTEALTEATITGATQTDPPTISAVNTFANGDWVYIADVLGMTQLNRQTYVIANRTGAGFTLKDLFGNDIDATGFGAYVSGGTAARLFTLTTPWSEDDIEWLKFTESADVMSLCCWNQDTNTSYQPADLARQADDVWTLTPTVFASTIAAPGYCQVSATANGDVGYQYVVTAVNPLDGTESIASPIGSISGVVNIALTAGSLTINWGAVPGALEYNIYKASPVVGGSVPTGALFGYAGTARGTQFVDSNIVPDFQQVPPTHLNPFAPGQIEGVVITSQGAGIVGATWVITTAAGTGFNGYPVIIGGGMVDFIITDTGKNYAPGDTIAFNGAGYAGGAITFAANPADGATITLNGVLWTFKTAISAGQQTMIQPTLALTLTRLVSDLAASVDPLLTVAHYGANATILSITYAEAGTAGNAYTLAASVATPSGATLTGGAGTGGSDPAATLTIGPALGTYPSVVSYYQQRRVYAATPNRPDTYWMSQPGSFKNMDARLPTIDSDAITGTPWAMQVNGIQALLPMPGGLVVMTGLGAWQLTGAGGSALSPQPISPASQQAQPQAFNGCSPKIPPIKIDYDIDFVQAKGSIVREFAYQYFQNIYTGVDTTILNSQLFTGFQLREWAWCEEPYKLLWAVRSDGALISRTNLKSQEVNAWCRHDTNGIFWSVTAVTEPPVDALYLATQRFIGGDEPYLIERMDNRIWGSAEDCWCVDCALSLPLLTPAATLTASSPTGTGSLLGITDMVGGSGYSAGTTVEIVDDNGEGDGAGAVALWTVIGGVVNITGFAFGGGRYSWPQIVITDPSGRGAGASARAVLDTYINLTASAAVFALGDVGGVIRMGGGVMTISGYADPEHVSARLTEPITLVIPNSESVANPYGVALPAVSGMWSLAQPVSTISGLGHLIGMSVTGNADGNEVTPRIVDAQGRITLDTPATKVTIGLAFLPQLQSVYLEAGSPTIQGQRKKIAAVTLRVEASKGLRVAANQRDGSTLSPPQLAPKWRNLSEVPDTVPGGVRRAYNSTIVPLYSADRRIELKGGFQIPGQIAIQQDHPFPLQVTAIVPEVLPGDIPQVGSGNSGRQRARGREAAEG